MEAAVETDQGQLAGIGPTTAVGVTDRDRSGSFNFDGIVGTLSARWPTGGLVAILGIAAFVNLWHLTRAGYGNTYYAAAVRSMTQSWHNFFFASFDPGGFITVDKPPVALWIQAAFAKVFGFSGFTILLPEALAGVGA